MLRVEGLKAADIQRLYSEGKKIHGFTGMFEIPANKLKDKADNKDGFPVASGINKNIEDFCSVKLSKDGKKALISVNWSDYDPKHEHLDAFLKKFGSDCMKDEIDPANYDINHDKIN